MRYKVWQFRRDDPRDAGSVTQIAVRVRDVPVAVTRSATAVVNEQCAVGDRLGDVTVMGDDS